VGLLRDIIAVATPTSEQISADPLSEFVIQTDPLVELLRKSGKKYADLTSSELRQRLGAFELKSHQKNLTEVDGKRPSRTGWSFSEINEVIEKGTRE
jgi:hypothetical protein